jgi:hypothetical protein
MNQPIEKQIEEKYGNDFLFQRPNLAAIRKVNNMFLQQDESHLWPVRNQCNVTKLAIDRTYRSYRKYIEFDSNLEYILALDAEISRLVNDPHRW